MLKKIFLSQGKFNEMIKEWEQLPIKRVISRRAI
jgi:hypothetical protein